MNPLFGKKLKSSHVVFTKQHQEGLRETLSQHIFEQHIMQVMHQLDSDEKMVFRLYYGVGNKRHTHREIAKQTSLPLSLVESLQRYAVSEIAFALDTQIKTIETQVSKMFS